ncbi:flagellar protein FlaG [Halioxenophilus aromaticivorans]|uniref:Flagellar protein FlaG n=1 Tax=Halioxenophilus aromaticivorans TaxID=1306992 RepID=A0AAV3TZT8_9ALTE
MEINNAVHIRPVSVTAKSPTDMDSVKKAPSEDVPPLEKSKAEVQDGEPEVEPEAMASVVENLNGMAQSVRRDLSFSLQDDTGKVVVEVTDSSTGELIRKIPSEEALKLSERIADVRSLMTSVKA